MDTVINNIQKTLIEISDPVTKQSFQRFFKDGALCYGVKTGKVREIAKEYWKEIRLLEKIEIFRLCEELFKSGNSEEASISAFWIPKLKNIFEEKDLDLFKKWIEKYVDNWAKCDTFCNHTIGDYLEKFPEKISELKSWAGSKNRWMKRAAAVSLIVPARKGAFLEDIFEIAGLLLEDKDDMVQKGYGWMLKEASRVHENEVFNYVMRNKKKMPRTALRYAIELMPVEMKAEAMKKDF